MKWLRNLPDSLIHYVADRMYDRLKTRVVKDLKPHLIPASWLLGDGEDR